MQRKCTTIGLILEASRVLHNKMGVLYNLERDAPMCASGTATSRVASWITRAASSRSELVICPSRLVADTKLERMSFG